MVPVTRERGDLAEWVIKAGGQPVPVEFIAIAPPADAVALEGAVAAWCGGGFDWLAVTSRNAVLGMQSVATASSRELSEAVPPARVAAVGAATQKVCSSVGLPVALTPETATARGLVDAFPHGEGTVLAPLGDNASAILARGLTRKGWTVTTVEAYRTVAGQGPSVEDVEAIASGRIDAVLLTSGSMASHLASACPSVHDSVTMVAIGETTAAAAAAAGLKVAAVAEHATYASLLEALVRVTSPSTSATPNESGRRPR